MDRIKIEEMKDYYDESKGIERDYITELLRSRKRAVRRSYVALFVGVLGLSAGFTTLWAYKPDPFILRVDNATGSVERLTTLQDSAESITEDEVLAEYFLNLFVVSYESYNYYTIQRDYDTTAILSSPKVQQEYYAIYSGDNARDEVLKDSAEIVTKVISVDPDVKNKIGVVRFTTQVKYTNGAEEPVKHWISQIGYEYVNPPIKEKDRRANPFGFQVTSNRKVLETLN